MAISIDWATKVINVPKADMTLLEVGPPEVRELNVDTFRLALKALEAAADGMAFLDTHRHNTTVTVGGVTLARVVEIINGYTVTFEDGSYIVTLSGANNNILDVLNLNNVQVRSANSAGLVHISEIEDQSYNGAVYINTSSVYTGTAYPIGTPGKPVNNFTDAAAIAALKNFNSFVFHNTLTLTVSDDIIDSEWRGRNHVTDILTLAGGAIDEATFEELHLTGSLNGSNIVTRGCIIKDVTGFDGHAHWSTFIGTLQIDAAAVNDQSFINCRSGVPGTARPIVDVNGAAVSLQFRCYAGGLELQNITNAGTDVSVDFVSGTLEIDATCTAGTIVVRGCVDLIDNSGPGCTVVADQVTPSHAALAAVQAETDLNGEIILKYVAAMVAGNFTETTISPTVKDFDFKDRAGNSLFVLRITENVGRTRTSG